MRYLIDYGFCSVEFTFEQITQRIEWRSDRFVRQQFGRDVVLVRRY